MTEFEQTLLFAATGIVMVGTIIALAWSYMRRNKGE